MRRRTRAPEQRLPGTATGPARVGRSSRALLPRLRPGDVAVIDQLDLDRETARALVDTGVVAVVNASASISGRFPNLGPELLANAGVVQVDMVGPDVLHAVKDGATLTVAEGNVSVGDRFIGAGRSLEEADVLQLMGEARQGLETQLRSFTANTVEFLRREQALILHGEGAPELRTSFEGRPVLVVVAGFDFSEDLSRVRRFVAEQKPVIVAVDAGADALLEARMKPDLLVLSEAGLGHRSSSGSGSAPVSDKGIRASREILVHADRSGHVVGTERLAKLGVDFSQIDATATTEDIALLLADIGRAALIVTVGVHATLGEFLDRQRAGVASTFLTQLRIGPKLVSASALPKVYAGGVRRWQLFLVTLAGVVALGAALSTTPDGAAVWDTTYTHLSHWIDSVGKAMNL